MESRVLLSRPVDVARGIASTPRIGLAWMMKLRWAAVIAQLIILSGAVYMIDVECSVIVVLALIGFTASTNAALHVWLRKVEPRAPREEGEHNAIIATLLVLDVLVLTGMLWAAGGPTNPFSVFYVVHVGLGALLLTARWTWILVMLTATSFAMLFVLPSVQAMCGVDTNAFELYLRGAWLSHVLACAAIGYFVSRVRGALREREQQLTDLDAYKARSEKLVALSALAAGTAHELATPLGTIALIAKELERASTGALDLESMRADARTLRAEADRCRSILNKLSARAGDPTVEELEAVDVPYLVDAVRDGVGEDRARRLEVDVNQAPAEIWAYPEALVQALVTLVSNAFDAHEEGTATVRLVIEQRPEGVCFSVVDQGQGMAPDVLKRLGEPFFTTKPTNRGMGLGLFLVRSFAEQARARLEVISAQGRGTRVELSLPARE